MLLKTKSLITLRSNQNNCNQCCSIQTVIHWFNWYQIKQKQFIKLNFIVPSLKREYVTLYLMYIHWQEYPDNDTMILLLLNSLKQLENVLLAMESIQRIVKSSALNKNVNLKVSKQRVDKIDRKKWFVLTYRMTPK